MLSLAAVIGATAVAGKKPAVIRTIEKALSLLASGPVSAHGAAQQLGMHLVDSAMEVTFTPRDREFATGSAVREPQKDELAVIILDVDARATVKYGPLRDAFGPFKMVSRQHPGDEAIFVAHPTIAPSKVPLQLSVTLRRFAERPADDDAVGQISITR